jgi:anaerobic dimethyl sulfoxide reductase subunit B (iron-sulfur subunit)
MARRTAFHHDSTRCTGCKACQVACKDRWDLPAGVTFRRVAEYAAGSWSANADGSLSHNVHAYYLSIACNHCQDARCVEVCPTTAMHRLAGGIVEVDGHKCVGCRYCSWACPYRAPQFDADLGITMKCNFCRDALEAGGTPSCVAACPTRALDFGELEQLQARWGTLREVAPLPPARFTNPSLVITPHRDAAPVDAGPVANPREV